MLLDYSIAAAAKRKLFKSEERTNTKNVYSCFVCSLCERETNLYFLWRRSSAKENPQKEQSFSTQKLFAKEQSFFFTFFLFFSSSKKELLTLLKRKSTYSYTVEREECRRHKHYLLRVVYIYISIPIRITHKTNTRRCSYTSRKESFRSCSCSPSTKTRTRR